MAAAFNDDDLSWSVVEGVHQSAPIDVNAPYSKASLAGKTILITGGASGFGAAFAREWAAQGSNIIIGDVSDDAGEALIAELRALPGSTGHYMYQHCDVTRWEDQVALFKSGVAWSPTGGIDAVVAGAGIAERRKPSEPGVFDTPQGLDGDNPPPPALKVLDVNLTGVMYTTHLAIFWLKRNSPKNAVKPRDRHLLLISSFAGCAPLPGQTEYTASKHAVMGLFRALRGTVWQQGIRVNVLAPYFVVTPLLNNAGLTLLAGAALGEVKDVTEAATRFMADEKVAGRGLMIGPKGQLDADGSFGLDDINKGGPASKEQAVWEFYAHDYTKVETFVWRYINLLNATRKARGWVGLVKDILKVFGFGKRGNEAPAGTKPKRS